MNGGIRDKSSWWLLAVIGLLFSSMAWAQRSDDATGLTDLEDFVIYANPEVMDALRKRPYSKKDAAVEAFFHRLPGINNEIYQTNLEKMRLYLERCKTAKIGKLRRITELAGLDKIPTGLSRGYEDRIELLETLLEWMENNKPVVLKRINIWKERELNYRLARAPLDHVRINPETGELESRLLINWQLIFQNRPKARDMNLDFDMGIHLQQQNGFYNPRGFLHFTELDRKNLKEVEVTYPVIITKSLEENLDAELPAYLSAYRTTINSFYQILQEYFFSDLADLHTLYVLTRGEIFADEWKQYQSTALQRGLAAHLVFQTFEEYLGKKAVVKLQENDWTTWHIRKIGQDYNAITWADEDAPTYDYGEYKRSFNMRNIYWSTLFVQSLTEQYGEGFVPSMCESLQRISDRSDDSDAAAFNQVTGDDLESALKAFTNRHANS